MAAYTNEATVPEELERAAEKFRKRDAGIVKAEGEGAGAHARSLASRRLPVLTDGLAGVMKTRNGEPALRTFFALVEKLDRARLALCLLDGALQGVGSREDNYTDTALHIAENIYIECYGKRLFKGYPKTAANKIKKRFASAPRRGRRQVIHELYKTGDWNPEAGLRVGNWGIDQLLEFLPGVFSIEERLPYKKDPRSVKQKPEKVVALTPEAVAYAEYNVAELIRRNPVWLPTPRLPARWEDWKKGGTSDHRLAGSLTIVSNRNKDSARAVRKAIRDGTMKPTLDALNALQAVPWTINKRVLDVLRACVLQSVEVDGVPQDDRADRVMFELDMQTAQAMAAHERFWTPMNLDWRGRVYGVPSFNLQRDDRVRALFLFADSEPIGEEGLYWLKVHVADCGDFEGADFIKVSKRPFAERVHWVEENLEKIKSTADEPLRELWWTKADKPFQFLAACFELSSALAQGPAFVSRLPISFDGSCSGLQHLSAMTRDEKTANRVNLTPSAVPQDIYETIHRLGLFRVLLTTGEEGAEPKINRRKAKNGVAPNCVHACDAAHLMRTVNAAVAEGITSIAAVHDSFGCLPSRAARFRKIILEQFVRMYEEHDVLAEVLKQARADLGDENTKRLPSAPPQYGSLDVKKVLSADFAFA